MAFTELSFPFGSQLTSAKMTQLFDNTVPLRTPVAGTTYNCRTSMSGNTSDIVVMPAATAYVNPRLYESSGIGQHTCYHCVVPGEVRVQFYHRMSTAFEGGDSRVLKNGSSIASWAISSNSWSLRSVDVTVARGDVITIQHKVDEAEHDMYIYSQRIRSSTDATGVVG